MSAKPIVRCSSLDQLLECHGSRTLIERIRTLRAAAGLSDRDSSGPQTWAGNWCHWQAARILIRDHGALCTTGLPEWPQVPRDFEPTPFDHWCVEYYVNTVMKYVGPDMAIEVENELAYDLGPCFLSGHQDFFAISADGRRGVGADKKRGANPVDIASENWQMSGYTVLDKMAYPDLQSMLYLIVQPGIPETDVTQRVSDMTIEGAELEALPAFLAQRIAEALAHPLSLNSGWRQCLYCDAALQCEALLADLDAMKIELTKEALARMKAEPDNEILARWKIGQKQLTAHMKTASDLLKERVAAAGGSLVTAAGSFAVKDAKGDRSIKSEAGWNRLCDITESSKVPVDPYECMELSPTKIIKVLKTVYDLPEKSEKNDSAEKQFNVRFGDITEQPTEKHLVVTS